MEGVALQALPLIKPADPNYSEMQLLNMAFAHIQKGALESALEIYIPLADNGNETAYLALTAMLKDRSIIATIIDYCKSRSDHGSKVMSHLLGNLYYGGLGGDDGIAADYEQAKIYYKRADKQNYVKSSHRLGMMNYRGDSKNNIPPDYARAKKYFEKVYEAGNLKAGHNLGNLYFFGHGVDIDYAKAYNYYIEASNAGEKASENMLRDKKFDPYRSSGFLSYVSSYVSSYF